MDTHEKSSWPAVLVGAGAFLVVGLAVFGFGWMVGLIAISKQNPSRGRPLGPTTPVLVVAHAMPAGKPLTLDEVSQRAVPDAMVSDDDVKPSDANYVVGQPLRVPLEDGDAVRWSLVEAPADRDLDVQAAAAACAEVVAHAPGHPPPASTVAELRSRVLEESP